ncbi:hypothetical protein ABZX90_06145 [Streptomyces sp. NPDC002935]|uniref:hypothetical protein n=1 Tax=Streptomyces sp. NPDC002935 TaxID=3154545 RepID=UPI0033AA9A91
MTSANAELGKAVTFDVTDGSISISGLAAKISRRVRMAELPVDLAAMVTSRSDMGNGWTWTTVSSTTLNGRPCTLSLGAFHGHLSQVDWSIRVAGGEYPGGRPSPGTVAKEMDQMTQILTRAFGPGRLPGRGTGYEKDFPWGSVWLAWDPRNGVCASGLRYSTAQRRQGQD